MYPVPFSGQRRRSPAGGVAAILLYGFVALFAGFADAADARAEPLRAHVEAEGGDDCPTHHDHLHCQVCRALTLPATLGSQPAVPVAPARMRPAAPRAEAAAIPHDLPVSTLPRAPPASS